MGAKRGTLFHVLLVKLVPYKTLKSVRKRLLCLRTLGKFRKALWVDETREEGMKVTGTRLGARSVFRDFICIQSVSVPKGLMSTGRGNPTVSTHPRYEVVGQWKSVGEDSENFLVYIQSTFLRICDVVCRFVRDRGDSP